MGLEAGEDNRIVIVTPFAGSEEVVVPPVPEVQPVPKVPQGQEVRSEEAQQAARKGKTVTVARSCNASALM